MASKSGFMKDALVLFAITLVSGLCLGFVYDITKGPIEQATIDKNNRTYQEVLSAASSFTEVEGSVEKIAELAASGELAGFGGVAIESVLEGTDASGAAVGYVINSLSNDSYGGAVKISVGFDADGTITGVGIREINDTPGLGLKAKEPKFKDQYIGKNVDTLVVTKTGASADNEIDAISGATVTSNAVTNAVNTAFYYLHNCMN
ncbi:MAG: RnfABCDGE type electron transport complex subunit G [Lachnospiraceae bacterium]|nr:RnfABCDGE type electron transport complex subunit G [Lachnospiraceae bacterium]MBQ2250805.1 RnfABCDGE type electron transport complex subunit G [Lachnospiraceae bacterium]MBQ2400953.1 RnfABCDGE type electron transport complex subunit G [Lachnospiraceae bacterium]MBQ2404292.1 RnfABCDGE type electron transport complex subunit G [Lachnospiraceae bacterium]MBQ5805958.1 RnfABCDGE type electron transport complex subunit G [Lachnospiraceae bacterium]